MREAFSEEMYSTAEGSIGCRLDLSWASLSRMAQRLVREEVLEPNHRKPVFFGKHFSFYL